MAQFEADLADEIDDDEEPVEDKSNAKQNGGEAWLNSDRDYTYDEVLKKKKRKWNHQLN